MGWLSEQIENYFGNREQRRAADDATNAANAANLSSASAMANAITTSTQEQIKARENALAAYRQSIQQAWNQAPKLSSITPQLQTLSQQQLAGLTGQLNQAQQQATQAYSQIPGLVQQTLGQVQQNYAPQMQAAQQGRAQMQQQLNPYAQAGSQMVGAGSQALMAALGLAGGDPTAALQQSPMYRLQLENQQRAIANQMAARGMNSGRSGARAQTQGERELLASELEKNIQRLTGVVNQGINLAPYIQQAAMAGIPEMNQAAAGLSNAQMSGLGTTAQAQTAIGQLPVALAGMNQQALQNYYNQQQEITRLPSAEGMQWFNTTVGMENTAMQNAINAANMQQQSAMSAAQQMANAQQQNAGNTLQTTMAYANQPSAWQNLLNTGLNLWGAGVFGNIKSPLSAGLGGAGQVPSTIGATNPMPPATILPSW